MSFWGLVLKVESISFFFKRKFGTKFLVSFTCEIGIKKFGNKIK